MHGQAENHPRRETAAERRPLADMDRCAGGGQITAAMSKKAKIEADFEIIRVQTMRDNAIRIVLEMPEYMIPQMGMFAECQRKGIYLHGEFTIINQKAEAEARDNGWDIDDLELQEFGL